MLQQAETAQIAQINMTLIARIEGGTIKGQVFGANFIVRIGRAFEMQDEGKPIIRKDIH